MSVTKFHIQDKEELPSKILNSSKLISLQPGESDPWNAGQATPLTNTYNDWRDTNLLQNILADQNKALKMRSYEMHFVISWYQTLHANCNLIMHSMPWRSTWRSACLKPPILQKSENKKPSYPIEKCFFSFFNIFDFCNFTVKNL